MKRKAFFGLFTVITLLITGCSNLFSPEKITPSGQGGGSLVRIYIGNAESTGQNVRTIQPSVSDSDIAGYQLTFENGPFHEPVDISKGNQAEVYLEDGTYKIIARAYQQGGTIGTPADIIAEGSVSGIVLSGGAVTSNGGIVPPIILGPASTVKGVLHYKVIKDNTVTGYIKLWNENGINPVDDFGVNGVLDLNGESNPEADYPVAGGRYIAEIRLVHTDGKIAFYRELVEVWPTLATTLDYEPAAYLDPGAVLANSGADLSAGTTVGGVTIGAGTGTGEDEANAKAYTIVVPNIGNAPVVLALAKDSQFSSISWTATAGEAPGGIDYTTTPPITNFTAKNTLWVQVVSEDTSTTRYYKFALFPPPPSGGAFKDTDTTSGKIAGEITWTPPSPPAGISGYRIYYGSDQGTKLAGFEETPVNGATLIGVLDESYTFSSRTPPAGAKYFLIYSYNSANVDYPVFLAVPFFDLTIVDTQYGAFTVNGTGTVSYTAPTLTINESGTYFISGDGIVTTDRISISANADIILENVNIDVSGTSNACAFDITNAEVNLTLKGSTILKSGSSRAGLQAPSGSTLTITADSTGTLEAVGGADGAGIGGRYYGSGGTISIAGASITATGGSGGAGIGGGNNGSGGTISIAGASITATGGSGGAGIGGGSNGSGGTISIAGASITATGGSGGAGIGGGSNGSGGTISIAGASITATGGSVGVGIGGGYRGGSGTIDISGNAVVFSSSIQDTLIEGVNVDNALIFNGNTGTSYGHVTLHQNLTITADKTLSILRGSILTIPSDVTLTNNGDIFVHNGGNINGTVTGTQPTTPILVVSGGASYTYADRVLTITGNGTYAISMENGVTPTDVDRIVVSPGVNADITLDGVHIDMSGKGTSAFDMSGATVNLTLTGTNVLKSGENKAGLHVPAGAALVITAASTGTLEANGAAGIGGGYQENGGTISIAGGTVAAIGSTSGASGAGIGGGFNGNGGTILIIGGTVTATGGVAGAGIGGGSSGGSGTIAISGNAVVYASSIQPALVEGVNVDNALVFNGDSGTSYGNVTLQQSLTITADKTLSVLTGSVLTIPSDVSLTNDGDIFVHNGGRINGTVIGIQPTTPILVVSGDSSYTYADRVLTITGNGTYTIGMKSGIDSTDIDRIVVSSGVNANITLSGVNIDVSERRTSAFDMSGADVNLTLAGTNVLKSGYGNAGLQVPGGATLVITDASTGTLEANGYNSAGIGGGNGSTRGNISIAGGTVIATGSAGIGGGSGSGGTILITGGTVTATATGYGAGIGSDGSGGDGGSISITGGTVTAIATDHGAGIGGSGSVGTMYGIGGSGGSILITGGTVTATSSNTGAGIGGGGSYVRGGDGGSISITGGTVTATSGTYGAGIGGGGLPSTTTLSERGGNGGYISITGGTVTATGSSGAGIGGGGTSYNLIRAGSGGSITITGGMVIATSNAKGIGGGRSGQGFVFGTGESGTLSVSNNAVVLASSIQVALAEGDNVDNAIVFQYDTGTQYGDVTLKKDLTIPSDSTLTIPSASTLTIPAGKTLTNNGKIIKQGTIITNGILDGTGTVE